MMLSEVVKSSWYAANVKTCLTELLRQVAYQSSHWLLDFHLFLKVLAGWYTHLLLLCFIGVFTTCANISCIRTNICIFALLTISLVHKMVPCVDRLRQARRRSFPYVYKSCEEKSSTLAMRLQTFRYIDFSNISCYTLFSCSKFHQTDCMCFYNMYVGGYGSLECLAQRQAQWPDAAKTFPTTCCEFHVWFI